MLTQGAVFAGYRIVRMVGAGGMGEVYLAQHPRLSRQDALKVLPAELTADGNFAERFRREADLTASLWLPHIVGVHDRGEFEGHLWISMDFVNGTDAARLLTQHPDGLPAADVVAIVRAIAEALDFAHEQGLLHRDVKPANILLSTGTDRRRRILLADFGIGREIAFASGLTETNMTVGTVNYAAPEQLMGEPIDGRADLYALAATAYHLLTGRPVFDHSNPAVVISRHLNAAPPPISDSHPDLAPLNSVLQRALAKDADDRFRSCADFADELYAAHEQLGSDVAAVDGPTVATNVATPSPTALTQAAPVAARVDVTPPTASQPMRRATTRMLVVGAAVVAGVALLAAILLWPRANESPPGSTAQPAPTSPPTTSLSIAPSTAPTPSTASRSPTLPPPPAKRKPPDTAVPLPSQYGSTFVITMSGKTACQVRAEAVGCQVEWTVPTPEQCCGPANGVRVTASGDWEWVTGDMGDQSYHTLGYGKKYRTLGWTISPTSQGTTFTHDATGHGMTVGAQGVDPF